MAAATHILSGFTPAQLQAAFHFVDSDGDGLISKAELKAGLQLVLPEEDQHMLDPAVKLLFPLADTNRDGLIDYDEMIEALQQHG